MKKIPSLFQRNYGGNRLVRPEVVPGCEWVLAGEGTATEKIDGTACAVIKGVLYKRYDRKKEKAAPPFWIACEAAPDPNTGHWPGWVLVGDGPEDAAFRQAWDWHKQTMDGTYELIGPKVQGNPYGLAAHSLRRHGDRVVHLVFLGGAPAELAFDAIVMHLTDAEPFIEGIVWHHADGRMAKIKRKDFGLPWPVKRKDS